MVKFAIVLIHNKNIQRLQSALAVVDSVRSSLGASTIDSNYFEIFQQPEIKPISRVELLRITILESILQINYFRNYLTLPMKYWLPYMRGFLQLFLAMFASLDKRKKRRIESIITEKHYQSWRIGQEFDFLIVFEDDIIQSGPLDELVKIAHSVTKLEKNIPTYIDLAGGYPPDKINSKFSDSLSFEKGKLYTNTACGYMINSCLAQYLVSYYKSHYFASKLGIDFFLNAAFSSLKTNLGFCFHSGQSGLSHGSFKGVFKSWTDQS